MYRYFSVSTHKQMMTKCLTPSVCYWAKYLGRSWSFRSLLATDIILWKLSMVELDCFKASNCITSKRVELCICLNSSWCGSFVFVLLNKIGTSAVDSSAFHALTWAYQPIAHKKLLPFEFAVLTSSNHLWLANTALVQR